MPDTCVHSMSSTLGWRGGAPTSLRSTRRAPKRYHAPTGQVNEDQLALEGDDNMEGWLTGGVEVARRHRSTVRSGQSSKQTCTTEARSGAHCDKELGTRAHSKGDISGGLAQVRRCFGEREVVPLGLGASLRCGASLGPAHMIKKSDEVAWQRRP
jgi:hypothetical protein